MLDENGWLMSASAGLPSGVMWGRTKDYVESSDPAFLGSTLSAGCNPVVLSMCGMRGHRGAAIALYVFSWCV